ncbi:50S ribosomal protein L24 [Candidatus Poribacteria bacterium]|nr:50S ribosomal protein L24 [Candidatus Poribacteria bacterium]
MAKQTKRERVDVHVKKGDRVVVIAGEARDAQGVVKAVDRKRGRVTVEGVNVVKRHTRPSQRYPNGGIVENEAPIHASNVRLVERD